MTVTQLECFIAIARARHFGRAAETLGKTQPALSLQIQRLEATLGLALFERTGRQIRLTTAGEILVPYAHRILGDLEESRTKMLEVKGGRIGVLRIGLLPTIAAHFLPPVLRAFKLQCPGVNVILREEPRTDLLAALVQNCEIDVSIARRPGSSAGLRTRELFTEDMHLAVPRKHRLAGKISAPLAELKGERFITYKSPDHGGTRDVVVRLCRDLGFEPKIEFESEQPETILSLVAADFGVAILPEMVLRKRRGSEVAVIEILPPTPSRTIVAAWKAGRYLAATTRKFLQIAEKSGKQWQANHR